MAVIFTITLLAMLAFASLYSAARENVIGLRERLEDAYRQRDAAQIHAAELEDDLEDAEARVQAAEAKAAHLAGAMRVSSENGFITEEDAFLFAVEADLDPELHGLAAIIGVDQDLAEVNDGPDITEEQA
jgi:hypothetical protein